jgi:plasmid stabilization system protein ParE
MKAVFLLAAEIDIQQAFEQYEEWSEGRGERFLVEMERAVRLICDHPWSCRLHLDDYRRCLISHFPRAVFYVIESDRIVIHAVMDLRQNPEVIARRLLGHRPG